LPDLPRRLRGAGPSGMAVGNLGVQKRRDIAAKGL
jgi:hypothetical protein